MLSEAVRAVVVVVVPLVLLVALDRPWLPAPDFVQLDVDARLDMFAHISVRKGATGAESGCRVKGLENKSKDLKGLSRERFCSFIRMHVIFPPKEGGLPDLIRAQHAQGATLSKAMDFRV